MRSARWVVAALSVGGWLCAASAVEAQEEVSRALALRTPGPPPAPSGQEGLSGRWVYLEQMTTVSDLTVIGETYSRVRAVALYDLEASSGRLRGAGTLCSLEMKTESRVIQTILPPAFQRSVVAPELDLEVSERGGVRQSRTVRVVGASLDDPTRDKLPQAPTDARVEDQDRDGHPGVTVSVRGLVDGDIYLVQRQWTELSGEVVGRDRIEGGMRFGKEEVVLGATSSVLSDPPPARPVYRRSFFRLIRVPEGTTCTGLGGGLWAR